MAQLFEQIVGILSPDLGESMARSCVDMYLCKAGVARELVGPEHLTQLVSQLKPGLSVFVGRAKAEHLGTRLMVLAERSLNGTAAS